MDEKNEATGARKLEELCDGATMTAGARDAAIIECKELRQALDVILQKVKNSPRKSRERSLVRTKLEESIMWLGMDLKDLGTPNPYPNSKDPSNTTVDPTTDGLKM